MRHWLHRLVCILWLAAPAWAASPPVDGAEPRQDARAALAAAAKLAPTIRWQPDSLLRADLDCDGHEDLILIGKGQDELVLLLLPDRWRKKPLWWRQRWRDVELASPQLSLEPLAISDQEFATVLGYVPEGYRRSSSCQGLAVGDGETDALHLYWNHLRGQLGMWSL